MGSWGKSSRVAAPVSELFSPGINCVALQHGPPDPFGMAHRQLGSDLAPDVVADERRALQPDFSHPGGEGVAVPGHGQDATGLLTLAEAGQVRRIDPMIGSQPLEGGDHVAARNDDPVHQYHGSRLGPNIQTLKTPEMMFRALLTRDGTQRLELGRT
jgi:hypothetical protein